MTRVQGKLCTCSGADRCPEVKGENAAGWGGQEGIVEGMGVELGLKDLVEVRLEQQKGLPGRREAFRSWTRWTRLDGSEGLVRDHGRYSRKTGKCICFGCASSSRLETVASPALPEEPLEV